MGECSNNTLQIVLGYRLLDDEFFKLVADDIAVCQELLRTLLGDRELIVLDGKTQVTEVSLHREIRIDVRCKLKGGVICNVEIQKSDVNDDVRRTRFHTSLVTANNTPKGARFTDIPDVIVIYISEYNVLRNGQRVTVVKRCQKLSDKYMPVDDGELIIFANTVFTEEELSNRDSMSDIDRLLLLFNERKLFYDEKFPFISNKVKHFKESKEGVEHMCAEVEAYAKSYAERCVKEEVAKVIMDKETYAKSYAERCVKEEVAKAIMDKEAYAKEKVMSNVVKMIEKGISIDDVVYITGLGRDEVELIAAG